MSPESSRAESVEALASFRTLELAAKVAFDTRALARAAARATASAHEGQSVSIGMPGAGEGDGWYRYAWHVWWAVPLLWRDDLAGPYGDLIVTIVRPDVSLSYVSFQQTLYTSEMTGAGDRHQSTFGTVPMQLDTINDRLIEFPLIRSRLPTSDWQIALLRPESYLGRPARRIRSTRRAEVPRPWDPRVSGFWEGIDEYECVIDEELGIFLGVTGVMDNTVVATISVENLSVDAQIPSGTFDFSPPADTRVTLAVGKNKDNSMI